MAESFPPTQAAAEFVDRTSEANPKPIWEMTRFEFHQYRQSKGFADPVENSRVFWREIKKALAEGKKVNPQVQREFDQLRLAPGSLREPPSGTGESVTAELGPPSAQQGNPRKIQQESRKEGVAASPFRLPVTSTGPTLRKGPRVILKDGRKAIVQRYYGKSRILIAFSDGSTSEVVRNDIAEEVRHMCESCKKTVAVPGERFCEECASAVIRDLAESGDFVPNPPKPPSEAKGRKDLRSSEWLSHQCDEDDYDEEAMP